MCASVAPHPRNKKAGLATGNNIWLLGPPQSGPSAVPASSKPGPAGKGLPASLFLSFNTDTHTLAWLLPAAAWPPTPLPGLLTYRVLRPSRPRNMPLRMDSSWLAVRCSSLTEAAPSKAPSSISDTLLLLRLLGEEAVGWLRSPGPPLPTPNPHARDPCPARRLPQNFPPPFPASVQTATFLPMNNSHFLQMSEFFKYPSGLQGENLIVV